MHKHRLARFPLAQVHQSVPGRERLHHKGCALLERPLVGHFADEGRANVDVRGNLVVCAILLVLGVVVLRFLRPTSATSGSRRWLPIAAFVAGPLVAFLWSLAEVFWLQPDFYLSFSVYLETLLPLLKLGIIVGTVGATVIWIGERLKSR